MRVNGEWFFAINGWINFLSLLLAARLSGRPFRRARSALAAGLGALYALAAYGAWPPLRGLPWAAAAALGMALLSFGRQGAALFPLTLAAEMFFSGLCRFLRGRGMPGAWALLCCGGAAAGLIRLLSAARVRPARRLRLKIWLKGKSVLLPALRDSGNLLRDPLSALPVIVAPARRLAPLLPRGTDPRALTFLPFGFRLLRVRTAAGSRPMLCFHPDRIELLSGGRRAPADALIALSPEPLSRALVPAAFFQEVTGGASL